MNTENTSEFNKLKNEIYKTNIRSGLFEKLKNLSEYEIKNILFETIGEENLIKIGSVATQVMSKTLTIMANLNLNAENIGNLKILFENFFNKLDEIECLWQRIEKIEDIADTVTKRRIKKIKETEFTGMESLKSLENEIKKIEDKVNYMPVKSNKVTNTFNYSLPQLKNNCDYIKIDQFTKTGYINVKKSDNTELISYEIENFEAVKKLISKSNISKLLTFSIYNINNNISKFTLREYARYKGLSENSLKKYSITIKNDLKFLKLISNISYKNEKKDIEGQSSLITDWKYNRGNISIWFNDKFSEKLKNYYYYIPRELISIDDKKYPHSWVIGLAIIDYIRQNPDKYIKNNNNIEILMKNTTLLNRTTLPKVKEVYNTDRHFQKRIINPILDSLDILTSTLKDYELIPDKDYKNIDEFLKGYTIIKFYNKNIISKYENIEKNKNKKSIKFNKEKQSKNINICKKHLADGKNKKEIAKLMDKSTRTIERYIQKINDKNN